MFDEIVVPVDGSSFGELALPVALGIACKSGGEVRLVTVVTPLSSPQPTHDWSLLEAERMTQAREHAEDYHKDLHKRVVLSGCDAPVSCHVEEGPVVEELDEHIRKAKGNLLVMTTHGRGPLRRAWIGSVADGLIRRTPCPILAIRPREGETVDMEEREFKRILVPLDGSTESREVLPYVRELASLFQSSLFLFRVVPPHFPLSSPYIPHAAQEVRAHDLEEEAAREALDAEARELKEAGFQVETRVELGAHPADEILELARDREADLIAMTTHGRGGVSRLVLGSVADKVVRGGTVPVFLHRAS